MTETDDFEALLLDNEDIWIWLPEFEDEDVDDPPATSQAEDFDAPTTSSKNPKPKKKKSQQAAAPRLPCPHCKKEYANANTLKTHLNSVALKDIAAHAPNIDDLKINTPQMVLSVISNVENHFLVSPLSIKFQSFVLELKAHFLECDNDLMTLSEHLSSIYHEQLQDKKCVTISKIRESVITVTNRLLCSLEFRESLKEFLSIVKCESEVMNIFIGIFMLKFCDRLLIYSIDKMLQSGRAVPSRKKTSEDFSSAAFKQCIHYIGGSVVAGILKRSATKKSSSSSIICDILKASFIEDTSDPLSLCEDDTKSWTSAQNRGRLTFLSMKAFTFFFELVKFTLSFEASDGSLMLDEVRTGVGSNALLLSQWDMLTGDSINEDLSLELLTSIVETVCRILSVGIIKRRLNDAIKKPIASVAFRAKVAR